MYPDSDLEYNASLWQNSEIMRNFVDILVAKGAAEDESAADEAGRRKTRGKSLGDELGPTAQVRIFRACDADENVFRKMDFVTRSLKWAREHAEHTIVVKEEDQHVITAMVSAKDLFHAPNPGEFFYDAPESVVGRRVGDIASVLPGADELERSFADAKIAGENRKIAKNLEETLDGKLSNAAAYAIERAISDIDQINEGE